MAEVGKKDFKNAKIYCIRNSMTDDIYIGSTTQPLSKIMVAHRSRSGKDTYLKYMIYSKMNEIGKEHFYIEKIQDCPDCKNVEDLRKIEGEWIRRLGTLNGCIAGRTYKQWSKENKDVIREIKKKTYQKNREQILQDKKQYYQDNKDDIIQRRKATFECECGSVIQTLKRQDI